MKSLFGDMITNELTLETIAQNFSYFFSQIHLLHLQTPSHSEHSALNVWDDVVNAKDSFLEELMGYEGRKVRSYPFKPITDYSPGAPERVIRDLMDFSKQLETYAKGKGYSNIENMAQDLGGKCAKVLFLLTQS